MNRWRILQAAVAVCGLSAAWHDHLWGAVEFPPAEVRAVLNSPACLINDVSDACTVPLYLAVLATCTDRRACYVPNVNGVWTMKAWRAAVDHQISYGQSAAARP